MHSLLRRMLSSRQVRGDIVVIDSVLPDKKAIGPRNSDFLEFVKRLPNFTYYTMYPMMPGDAAWFSHGYGMTKPDFTRKLAEYVRVHPEASGRIKLLSPGKTYRCNLAYTYFLAETYTLLPFLERNKIPFVFLLNPGGAFGINNPSSDDMLRAVCSSKYFRKMIVNQRLLQDYVIKKKLCPKEAVLFDFSGSVQFKPADVQPKKYYPRDKPTFDICFVAAKYSPKGVDKGYDLFIAAAKQLAPRHADMRFHVVGGFDEHEIDTADIRKSMTFYGFLPPETLPEFYAGMDIFLSPNRPFKLYKGNSDGFPLSAGAMYCGVCGVNADELHMNTEFDADEVVIVRTQAKDIVQKIERLYAHPDELYRVSKKGQQKAQRLYDIEKHIQGRIKLFEQIRQQDAE
ncbi:MAG TPA: glycosyltransferase family 4 protein [Candidatus Saccharimonadales bacterium]|nr:glycosyltransferase family 4 protein [Candidatus Saccharimonadales bacterium]